jgi:hypothetical protein
VPVEAAKVVLVYAVLWSAATLVIALVWRRTSRKRITIKPFILIIRIADEQTMTKLDGAWKSKRLKSALVAGPFVLVALQLLFYHSALQNIASMLRGGERIPVAVPLLPGLTISVETFLLMTPGLAIAVAVHELAHALAAISSGVKVKSVGLALVAGILPLAFVEPDEDELKSSKPRDRVVMYSAGVYANAVAGALVLLLVYMLTLSGSYLIVLSVEEGSPAAAAGLERGMLVEEVVINGTEARTLNEFVKQLYVLREQHGGTLANVTLVFRFKTPQGTEVLVRKPSRASPSNYTEEFYERIGIQVSEIPRIMTALPLSPLASYNLFLAIRYTAFLNLGLGIINAAPLFITDGAQVVREAATRLLGTDRGSIVAFVVSLITLIILIPGLAL